ncbi:hypothetical protein CLCR_10551 [Cladophialophora carrionii]|uniref:Uncharacterized protein n=1 Tax=Cladophialophora carrionii TaxID=86049 RepID=A0A1C1CZR7_9EURO|nr:hypothetical protein CLCR_10551 [Cladophialophora carrionii]
MALSTAVITSQYVTETTATTVIVSPTLISSDVTVTVTSHLASTLIATFGQTVTIHTPSSFAVSTAEAPTTKYTPSPITATDVTITQTGTSTFVITELDLYLQNTVGSVYSTWILPVNPPVSPNPTTTQPFVYVVEPSPEDSGWDTWSTGERAGLIVGTILGACLLFGMIWYYCRKPWKGNWWLAHDQPVGVTPVVGTPGPNFVQPTYVSGPIVPRAYQHGYGYGLRGGDAGKGGKRLFSGRNWFSVKGRGVGRNDQGLEARSAYAQERNGGKASGKNWFAAGRRSHIVGGEEDAEAADGGGQNAQHVEGGGRALFYQPPQH